MYEVFSEWYERRVCVPSAIYFVNHQRNGSRIRRCSGKGDEDESEACCRLCVYRNFQVTHVKITRRLFVTCTCRRKLYRCLKARNKGRPDDEKQPDCRQEVKLREGPRLFDLRFMLADLCMYTCHIRYMQSFDIIVVGEETVRTRLRNECREVNRKTHAFDT